MLRVLLLLPAAEIVIANDFVAVLPAASVTLSPNVLVPALAGVPENMPLVAKFGRARPVLQEPEQEPIDHV